MEEKQRLSHGWHRRCASGKVTSVAGLVGWVVVNLAGSGFAFDVPLSLAFEEFRQLEAADQRALVTNAIGARIAASESLQYIAEMTFRHYEYHNGEIEQPLPESPLCYQKDHRWKLKDSYRIDTTRPIDRSCPDPSIAPMMRESLHWDNSQGVVRNLFRYDGSESFFARIDSSGASVGESDRFQLFVCGGEYTRFGEFLLPQVIAHEGNLTIECLENEKLVKVTLPWEICIGATGSRSIVLDCQKGFLPVRGYGETQGKAPSLIWQKEGFTVSESSESSGIWYPVQMREYVAGPAMGPEVVGVYDTSITFLEVGKVEPSDLSVTFPSGTRVINAIDGVSYKIGVDGKSVNVESLVGNAAGFVSRNHKAASGWRLPGRLFLIAVNIAGFVAVAAWVRSRRGARVP